MIAAGELFDGAHRFIVENALWIALAILIVWILIALFGRRDDDPGDEGGVAA